MKDYISKDLKRFIVWYSAMLLTVSTWIWPIPVNFQNIIFWLLLTSLLLSVKMVLNEITYGGLIFLRIIFIGLFLVIYKSLILGSQLSTQVLSVYTYNQFLIVFLWFAPIWPIRIRVRNKVIKINDWFVAVYTLSYIASFELLNYFLT